MDDIGYLPFYRILSRRDRRTQPGVLTPGIEKRTARPEGAEDTRSAFRLPKREWLTHLCRPFRAGPSCAGYLGLKPQAQSCSPFGTKLSLTSHFSLPGNVISTFFRIHA
jgi:hypothetical protein